MRSIDAWKLVATSIAAGPQQVEGLKKAAAVLKALELALRSLCLHPWFFKRFSEHEHTYLVCFKGFPSVSFWDNHYAHRFFKYTFVFDNRIRLTKFWPKLQVQDYHGWSPEHTSIDIRLIIATGHVEGLGLSSGAWLNQILVGNLVTFGNPDAKWKPWFQRGSNLIWGKHAIWNPNVRGTKFFCWRYALFF